MSDEFLAKSHFIGDHKNVKTRQQCMFLMEKTEFLFFNSIFFGIAPCGTCPHMWYFLFGPPSGLFGEQFASGLASCKVQPG